MKKALIPNLYFLILFLFLNGSTASAKQLTFYVSNSGNDSWSGQYENPKNSGQDGPFATLGKARESIRELKKQNKIPSGGVRVFFRGGVYSFSDTFKLTNEDSGNDKSPTIWSAYKNEKVRFVGGKVLTGFAKVTDPDIIKRLDSTSREKIVQTDLKKLGISDYGEIDPLTGKRMELFFKEKYMSIARYPSEGWLKIASVPQTGDLLYNEGRKEWIMFGVPRGKHYGRFAYDGDRPERWSAENDVYAHGYWVYDWSDQIMKIDRIDIVKKEIYPQKPHHHYGYQQEARYYFLNILEELDSPGEFYIDRKNGVLFFYPPSEIGDGDAVFPILEKPMISLDDVSNVEFEGIIFESSRFGAVNIKGGRNNTLSGCTFRNLGNDAVVIDGGTGNGVKSSDIYEVAAGGVKITGGDRKTLTPAKNYADNNHIHHFARVIKTYRGAVNAYGVGNIITHNKIHDAPHLGIWFEGNDHIIEYNDMSHVAEETGDVGAIYTAFDWTYRGNKIKYNYLHNIHGPVYLGCMTVYFDMPVGGNEIFGNVFYDLDKGFFTNSGRDNLIENNIFIKCNPSVAINVYYSPKEYALGGSWRMVERLNEMNINNPPYSVRYPELQNIFNDGEPAMPRGNRIIRNISYGGRFMELHSDLDLDIVSVKDNLIADPNIARWIKRESKESQSYVEKYSDEELKKVLEKNGNVIIDTDPGFMNASKEDFRLKDSSPAYKLGFKKIPFEKIGLYKDNFRKVLPEK